MCPNWKIYPTYINLPVLSIICFQLAFLPIELSLYHQIVKLSISTEDMTHSQMLGKVESGGGPIFKVVLECFLSISPYMRPQLENF